MLAAASPAVPQSASRPAARRALIVIDVQNEYVTGNLPIEYPPLDVSLANIGRAIDAAHASGVPVIVVQHVAPAGAPIFAPGTDGVALHTVVTSRPYAHLIEKAQASSFAGTDLAAWLDAHGIDTLAVTGYMTHNCNASTVYHAAHAGLKVEYLNDATGALPYENEAGAVSAEEIHRTYAVVFQSNFAAVMSTDAWIAGLAGAPMPARDSVAASNRRARARRAKAA
ncbi:cysteine hydrolase family protein [Burkholderia cenocepacia]|uniref:cysteine hydrolase family protein n=1 Tax=Burkholderia cenocepacia TaxID=95486 RepID=UPI000D0C56F4|nr:cysteine hydrolase family protein [Burkholderia cenocepacia]SOT40399.1 putative Amidase, nicotinamidase-like [Burkholderia cenocepacia]